MQHLAVVLWLPVHLVAVFAHHAVFAHVIEQCDAVQYVDASATAILAVVPAVVGNVGDCLSQFLLGIDSDILF